MSNSFPKNPTPSELRKAYAGGFAGSKCDPADVAELLGDLSHPLFGASAWTKTESKYSFISILSG